MGTEEEYRPLKNERAEQLRQQGKIMIGDLEVKLWTTHTRDSVRNSLTWDQIGSIKDVNYRCTGERGSIVITGTLQVPRREAADLATRCGYRVTGSVSRLIDYIVLGSENVSPSKVAKALSFIEEGHDIHFIDENEFLAHLADIFDSTN